MEDITKLWDEATESSRDRSRRRGQVGLIKPGGGVSVKVPGKPGKIYVRLGDGAIEAWPKNVALKAHTYVMVYKEDGEWIAEGAAATINSNGFGSSSVTPHTHRRGSGNEYVGESELFAPGLVLPSSGLVVSIGKFRYPNSGNGETYLGGTLDLTANLPVTAGTWAWILIALDPSTNLPVAVTGTEYATQAELTVDKIDDIAATNLIPLGAVQANQADTVLTDFRRFFDAKVWYVPADSLNPPVLADGTRPLTSDWDIGDALAILTGLLRARNIDGLRLEDDAGNLGVIVNDGGNVGIGGIPVTYKLELVAGDMALDNNQAVRIKDSGGVARGMLYMTSGDICALGPQGGLVVSTQIHAGSTLPVITALPSGKVGIGMTPATEILEILGNISLVTDANNYSRILHASTASGVLRFENFQAAGISFIDINPRPEDGTSQAIYRIFRTTTTTGGVAIDVHKGDGTSARNASISGNSDSFLAAVAGGVGIGGVIVPETELDVDGAIQLREQATTPPSTPSAGVEAQLYVKGDKLIVRFNDAGTVRYKYLDLTGTGVTWVHTTTAP